jgi:inward rectifier potassium channel
MERLRAQQGEIFLSLSGLDETFAQTIHARHHYTLDDIAWNHRFADVLEIQPDGARVIDYSHFHEVVPIDPREPAPTTADRPQT